MKKRQAPEPHIEHSMARRSQTSVGSLEVEKKSKKIKTESDQIGKSAPSALVFRTAPTPAMKRAKFLDYLRNVAGSENELDYGIAQEADLLAQDAFSNPQFRHSYGKAVSYHNTVMDLAKSNAEKAAAAYKLAGLYRDGEAALRQNCEQSIAWYAVAALLGNAQAQFELARFYDSSAQQERLEEDFMQARKWYQKAAHQFPQDAQPALSELMKLQEKARLESAKRAEIEAAEEARLESAARAVIATAIAAVEQAEETLLTIEPLIQRLTKTRRRYTEGDKYSNLQPRTTP